MRITPDFSESAEFNPIPPGVYKARIVEVEDRVGRDSGKPYLNWKLQVFGAEGELEQHNNRVVYTPTPLAGKGAFRLRELCHAAGYQPTTGEPFDTDDLLGKEVEVTLVDRINQQGVRTDYSDVKSLRPLRS